MIKKAVFYFTGICILCLFSTACWSLDFTPGQYEITSKIEMPGMPGTMPPQTVTQCMTQQDQILKNSASGSQACKIKDMTQTGSIITWKMECNQDGQQMESEGKMVYKGDTFEGTIKTIMGPQAGNMVITTMISGKRIGDCEKSD